jgi:hypothetical protein
MTAPATTHWVEYLRACIRDPASHRELDPDNLQIDAGLSMLRGTLDGAPAAASMSDAALELLEHGALDEQRALLGMSLRGAPALGTRVARIARGWRDGPLDERIRTLLLRGIEAEPQDPELLAALQEEAGRGGERTVDALNVAAPYNAAWVAAHVGLLTPELDPDGKSLAWLALRTQVVDLPTLVDGIAAAGAEHVTRFIGALNAGKVPPHVVERLRPVLAAHPAFAGRVPDGRPSAS